MYSKEDLIKQSEIIKTIEERAEKRYADLIGGLNDTKIIEIIDPIRKDEQKHQRIMQEIIDILEKK